MGVLVQANHGDRNLFRVDGVPVGREINRDVVPIPGEESRTPGLGSIIVVIATDSPLIPSQCKRLAQRATVGLARVGSVGHNGSGDSGVSVMSTSAPASAWAGAASFSSRSARPKQSS